MAETQVLRVTRRELDYLVAEHVYGWKRWDTWEDQARTRPVVYFIRPDKPHPTGCPKFAEDHNAAADLKAKMRSDHWLVHINTYFSSATADFWHHPPDKRWPDNNFKAEGTTEPIAICKAALGTKGIHVEVITDGG